MPISHLLAQSMIMELENDPANNKIEEEKVVLIDTDGSTDDAWALLMAIAAHRNPRTAFRLVGITCTHGVGSVDAATENVAHVLQSVNETNIPVFRGAESALVYSIPKKTKQGWSSAKGLFPVTEDRIEPEHAVNAMIELAKMHRGNLSLLCLGPLTNLALALKMHPELRNMFKEVVILGGNHQGSGNASPAGEFHFVADAEAAHMVLHGLGHSTALHVVPWETCVKAQLPMEIRQNKLGSMVSDEMTLMNAIEAHLMDDLRDTEYAADWGSPAALATAALIEPELTKALENYFCTVELHGAHSRGMMVVDKNFIQKKQSNAAVVKYVDMKVFEEMLVWAAGGPDYKNRKH